MIRNVPLPGLEELAAHNAKMKAERDAARIEAVVHACLDVIAQENRGTLNARSWSILKLRTALSSLQGD
jgi:hypothetical protein